ncbi:unnamed protein product [Miscanthus lutarioriparius]|uniref:Uncharacterized protein n=1 Tax=Miscanthus lutarioriparius TaxID=422564 RepID=A0A811SMT5_9POAL|nr:unnamed protein product [Miscanthus lutarioriparius]
MEKLSKALEYYIRSRLNSDPGWKGIKLEKVNTRSCLSSSDNRAWRTMIQTQGTACMDILDADLIMLALASHELHFSILREFLNIWVLREYLELDLKIPNLVVKTDIERLIDDFIFISFLTGNDFIPHIPSVEIHEGAIDLLLEVYKQAFNKMGGYIVSTEKLKDKHAAYLKVSRLEKFFHELSLCEEKFFLKRYELREKLQRNLVRRAAEEWKERNYDNMVTANTLELRRNLKDTLRNKQDLIKSGACKHDAIRLGFAGWKSRFYREKFGVEKSNEVGKLKNDMVQKYLEGLCRVLQYYFADVPSWSWYYPFYYAPFASDFKGLSHFKISFTADKPLRPFDQLMAVLPKQRHIDTHGKRFLWQGIAMLPFIDERLLILATKTVEDKLAVHEINRNTVRRDKIFLRNSNTMPNGSAFAQTSDCLAKKLPLDPSTSELGGWLSPVDDDIISCGFLRSPIRDLQDIRNDQTISFLFSNPEPVQIIPRLLDNVQKPEKTVTETEIPKRPLWHTYPGSRPPPETIPTVAEPQSMISGFGRGRGRAITADSALGGGRGYGRSFYGADVAQSRGCTFGSACAGRGQYGGVFQRQQTAWRPVGNSGGCGGSEQHRGW